MPQEPMIAIARTRCQGQGRQDKPPKSHLDLFKELMAAGCRGCPSPVTGANTRYYSPAIRHTDAHMTSAATTKNTGTSDFTTTLGAVELGDSSNHLPDATHERRDIRRCSNGSRPTGWQQRCPSIPVNIDLARLSALAHGRRAQSLDPRLC